MALERLALQAGACAVLALAAWLWHADQLHDARLAGRAEAVAAGKERYDAEAAAALVRERTLRAKLSAADAAAQRTEQTYAENLTAAQRRIRAGDDSLRIAVRTIRANATAPGGPAAAGPAPDGAGDPIVPEVAGDILSLAADTGRVVRKYQRLVERFDECRALNNGPAGEGEAP